MSGMKASGAGKRKKPNAATRGKIKADASEVRQTALPTQVQRDATS